MNDFKSRLQTLRDYGIQYLRLEEDENPTGCNHLLRQMSYLGDRMYINVWQFIQELKQEKATSEAKAESTLQKAVLHPALKATEQKQDGSFICSQCGQSFASQKALSGHGKLHRKIN